MAAAPPKAVDVATAQKNADTAESLSAIADKTRVSVLRIIGDQSISVCDLAKHIGVSQPALSHHLALLRASRLIISNRQAKQNFYRLSPLGTVAAKLIDEVVAAI